MAKRYVVNSGRLRKRVSIQDYTQTKDEYGEITKVWFTTGKAWAEVIPFNGTEKFQAEQTDDRISHKVTFRFREDLRADMRILFKGRTLGIEFVQQIEERNRKTVCMCLEDPDNNG